ncbi:MAG: hypothetical protein JKX91_08620 [Rhizobiaceae bacterium]|nr:hypothetical protein [Rhizobiaceae bacterium]
MSNFTQNNEVTTRRSVVAGVVAVPLAALAPMEVLAQSDSAVDPHREYLNKWRKADWDYAHNGLQPDGDIDFDHPETQDALDRCCEYGALICETPAITQDGLSAQIEFYRDYLKDGGFSDSDKGFLTMFANVMTGIKQLKS